jgi:hypothetical protein
MTKRKYERYEYLLLFHVRTRVQRDSLMIIVRFILCRSCGYFSFVFSLTFSSFVVLCSQLSIVFTVIPSLSLCLVQLRDITM